VLSIEKSRINFMPAGIFDGMAALVDLKISDGKGPILLVSFGPKICGQNLIWSYLNL
jgi:hypothetical protein